MKSKTHGGVKLKIHPELAAWLPDLEEDELHQLRANLERDGCLAPILSWNGYVIDGHQRYALCDELGIGFRVKEMEFDSIEQVKLWMVKHQRGRRNWTEDQYALSMAAAMKLKPTTEGRPANSTPGNRENAEEKTVTSATVSPPSISDVARETGINRAVLSAAAKVENQGGEPLKEAVRDGAVRLRDAAKIADKPKREQRQAIKDAKKKPSPKDDGAKDELGADVPENLREVFAARDTYKSGLQKLRELATLINPIIGDPQANMKYAPAGLYLADHRSEIVKAMATLRNHLNFAMPYALCPVKHGGKRCNCCRDSGWLTKEIYERSGVK